VLLRPYYQGRSSVGHIHCTTDQESDTMATWGSQMGQIQQQQLIFTLIQSIYL